ncbi:MULTISPECIES: type I restriction endonuclease subunit R [unclassified Pyramidobacter]|uniref:type I restriction endonuclease subunit R n=1 Tax=unclassified Pyramidobacter TaxID=2632171 RepID=UPI000EA16D65|nr:type I restriction endonuclease subunit R [Pyramidobacter sp. CG50-2]RKJ81166.1 type I restriction endonuclease subunit R [Pyramidobacter sp. CG50-2]
MPRINEAERKTQNRVLALFQDKAGLNYAYLGDLHGQLNTNIMVDRLTAWLTSAKGGGYSQVIAERAVSELVKATGNLQQGLYKANQNVYSLLKYGAKVRETPGAPDKTVYFIDWKHSQNNEFAVAEEVTIKSGNERRPDIVVYVNGIALAVIELKKSTVSVSQGIRQNLSNQSEHFNKPFFSTIQFVMAGNTGEGLRYAAIETPEKYYLEWKNDAVNTVAQPQDDVSLDILEKCKTLPNKLDWQLFSMFQKRRFLDLIHNFIVFDKGVKKVCRHNQFFGVKKAQIKLNRKQGGIIWHTQGSGKTLTMVWLSKWILAENPEARVLIITDRDELDEQMEKVYLGVNEQVYRTKSCDDLVKRLDKTEKRLICSLIHKFGVRTGSESSEAQTKKSVEQFIRELKAALPTDFKAKGDFVVFVDECHRTQSGLLHEAMKEILPNAIFIGFTGTPLLVKDRKTSIEVFAPGYIHTYKYDEAVADGVVLDLRYEARDIEQIITNQERIDQYFDMKTRGLNDAAKAKLKSKWGNMQKVYSSLKRLEVIAEDVITDFDIKNRLADGNGNAMLVADSIYSACKYYEVFQSRDFRQCAIVTSFMPLAGNLRTEAEDAEEFKKFEVYTQMLNGQSTEDFEAEAKRKFIEEPAQMKLLIVVDKLLTGFDAPPCTYLYIDKSMHDHGLFQAICRVNRLDGEEKDFGYIVDYKQLFGDLANALSKYTAGAFEGYDAKDVEGLIKDRLGEARKYLDATLEELEDLCGGVPAPRAEIDYIRYFCGEDGVGGIDDEFCSRSREKLYKLVNRLIRAYAGIKGEMEESGYTVAEQADIDKKVTFYTALKETIGNASGDFIDLKSYEADMRRLIDIYIKADDSRKIGEFDDFTLLDFVLAQGEKLGGKGKEAAAEAIENNIRKKIVEKILINPKYYEKMSAILDELIKARREGATAYEEMLSKYIELVKNAETPENNPRYPESIRYSGALRALFDNCGEDEALALALDKAVRESKQDGFRHNEFKERRIKQALYKVLKDKDEVEKVYNIVVEQGEY